MTEISLKCSQQSGDQIVFVRITKNESFCMGLILRYIYIWEIKTQLIIILSFLSMFIRLNKIKSNLHLQNFIISP